MDRVWMDRVVRVLWELRIIITFLFLKKSILNEGVKTGSNGSFVSEKEGYKQTIKSRVKLVVTIQSRVK